MYKNFPSYTLVTLQMSVGDIHVEKFRNKNDDSFYFVSNKKPLVLSFGYMKS